MSLPTEFMLKKIPGHQDQPLFGLRKRKGKDQGMYAFTHTAMPEEVQSTVDKTASNEAVSVGNALSNEPISEPINKPVEEAPATYLSSVLELLKNFGHAMTSNFTVKEKMLIAESLVVAPLLPLVSPIEFPSAATASLSQVMNPSLIVPRLLAPYMVDAYAKLKIKLSSDPKRAKKWESFSEPQKKNLLLLMSLASCAAAAAKPIGALSFVEKSTNCSSLPHDYLYTCYPPAGSCKSYDVLDGNGKKILAGIVYEVLGSRSGSGVARVDYTVDYCDEVYEACSSFPHVQERLIGFLNHENATEFLTAINRACPTNIVMGEFCMGRIELRGLTDFACNLFFGKNPPAGIDDFSLCHWHEEYDARTDWVAPGFALAFMALLTIGFAKYCVIDRIRKSCKDRAAAAKGHDENIAAEAKTREESVATEPKEHERKTAADVKEREDRIGVPAKDPDERIEASREQAVTIQGNDANADKPLFARHLSAASVQLSELRLVVDDEDEPDQVTFHI